MISRSPCCLLIWRLLISFMDPQNGASTRREQVVEANTTVAEKSELFNRPGRHCRKMAVTAIISPVLLCELCGKASKQAKKKKNC